jgi:hypothetical protein
MTPDPPVACSLDAPALARRQSELRTGVLAEAIAAEPLPDGMRWRFRGADGLIGRLAAVIEAERRCCRFLRFTVDARPDLGEIVVDVTGPAGTRDVLAEWLPR